MVSIIYRKKFKKSIKMSHVYRNNLFLLLSDGSLISLKTVGMDIKEEFSGKMASNVFFTENYFMMYENGKITIRDMDSGWESKINLGCNLKDVASKGSVIYALCPNSVIRILKDSLGTKKLFDVGENYRKIIVPFEKKDLICLTSLWGITCVKESGDISFFRTFGDLILTPQICYIEGKKGILIGSKNGWIYYLNMEGEVDLEYEIESGLTAYKVYGRPTGKIFYANSKGEVKYFSATNPDDKRTILRFDNTVYGLEVIEIDEEKTILSIITSRDIVSVKIRI